MDSIGQTLQEARKKKGVTLSQAAAATRIKLQHIESMERDDFSRIAADTYARGFIKIYAEYLGLHPEPLLRLYQQSHASPVAPSLIEEPASEAEAAAAEGGSALAGADLPGAGSPIRRVLLAGGLVLALLAALIGWAQRSSRQAEAASLAGAPRRAAEPPEPYLDLDPGAGVRP